MNEKTPDLLLGANDLPKNKLLLLFLGIQPLLIYTSVFSQPYVYQAAMNLNQAQTVALISAFYLGAGICTLLQATIGNRLPIWQGQSISVMGPASTVGGIYGLPTMYGSLLIGGLIEGTLGATKLIGKIKKLMPPVVSGSVVATIGLSLLWLPGLFVIGRSPSWQNWVLAGASLLVILFCYVIAAKRHPMIGMASVLIGIIGVGLIVGSLIGSVNWTPLKEAKWFASPHLIFSSIWAGPWGPNATFKFVPAAILAVFLGYLASAIESVGDYHAIGAVSNIKIEEKHISRGIMAEGFGCALVSFFGCPATTTHTEQVGLIRVTRIASRYLWMLAGVFAIILAFIPKFAALIAVIPAPARGGLLFIVFGFIIISGLRHAFTDEMTSANFAILGCTIGISTGIYYFLRGSEWLKLQPSVVRVILGSGVIMAVLLGITLNILFNLLPQAMEKRKA
jgi:uracil-xanthine permease